MGNIIDLSDRREPVCYTVEVTHAWDGTVSVEVHNIAADPRSRKLAADALLRAAVMLESDREVILR